AAGPDARAPRPAARLLRPATRAESWPGHLSCFLAIAIGIERGPADPLVEIIVKAREGVWRYARKRLELDGREGETGRPARRLGVLEEPLAEILVGEKLPQRPFHCLLSHCRPPRFEFAAAP